MSNQEITTIEQETDVKVEAVLQPELTESPSDSVLPTSETSQDVGELEADQVDSAIPFPEAAEDSTSESDSLSIHNLKAGQRLIGTVKNITDFGAFVDLGIAQDGLVHISELAKRKVEKVTDVVSQGKEVDVWVKRVDKKRGRISLTMIKPIMVRLRDISVDAELEGIVTRLEAYGAFVDIGSDRDGLVHISQITHDFIKHPEDVLAIGDKIKVKVLKVNRKKRQIDLSIKALLPPPQEEVKEVKEVKVEMVEQVIVPSIEQEMPTAMAIAYAALQSEMTGSALDTDSNLAKGKRKQKRDMDAIVARTLASRES